jgi:S-adenosylmethionine:tRNA ribosyltransferase-isomerase
MALPRSFSLSDFDYELPESRIAQKPADPRDHSRLLVYNRSDRSITDDIFLNLPHHLPEQTVLVINNSRVEKARLVFGRKEVFITRVLDPHTVEAMIRPGKAFRKGRQLVLSADEAAADNPSSEASTIRTADAGGHQASGPIRAEVLNIAEDGLRTLRFNYPVNHPVFEPYRRTPFPPYIEPDENLADRYQTVYARDEGSKAAPTAGLHFTDRLFGKLSEKAIETVELTLHVGLGTFAPVKTERIDQHKMHSEWFRISDDAANRLNRARHITAVGTTSARVLESAASDRHAVHAPKGTQPPDAVHFRNFRAMEGDTDIFITPGYQFRAMDALVTNFHLPKSTLLMMIAAFTGIDEMHRIYEHAIRSEYRFYSFGDAMLLL